MTIVDTVLQRPPRRISARAIAACILAFGLVISVALNWPGQLSYDSIVQLHDGRTGHYNPWHPPVMAWLLGLEDALLPGTGLFILIDALLIFAGLASLLLLSRRVSWTAILIAAICAVLPQFVLYQGIVWKDVLFADAGVTGFLLLAHAASSWRSENLRWFLITASFLFLMLATLVRQNGVIALAFGGFSLAFIGRMNGYRWSKAVACGVVATLVSLCLVLAASLALLAHTGGASGTPGQIKLLQLYDLIGVEKIDPAVALDRVARANPDLERMIRSDGVRLYTPARNDTLVSSKELQKELNATSPAVIAAQWANIVLHYPGDYVRVRSRVFAWTFFTPDLIQCDGWYTGVDGPPSYLRNLHLVRRTRPQDQALAGYAALFAPTPVYSHATYVILAMALLPFLLWRRCPADLAIAGLLVGALVFVASFFVISIACDYRYMLFLDLAALASLFYCAATYNNHSGIPRPEESSVIPGA